MKRFQKLLLPVALLFVVIGNAPAQAETAQHKMLFNAVEGKAIEIKNKKVFQQQFLSNAKHFTEKAGDSPAQFDSPHAYYCSGFVQDLYRANGIWIPAHSVAQQTRFGQRIDKLSNIEPGDLVFLSGPMLAKMPAHVAVAIGNGKLLHASGSGKQVSVVSITPEVQRQFMFAARLISSV